MNRKLFFFASLLLLAVMTLIVWQFLTSHRGMNELTAQADRPAALQSQLVVRESRFTSLTDTTVRWQVHVDSLRNLDAATLGEHDVDVLYSLLHHTPQAGYEEQWWVVVNEIMEQMRLQAIAPERYTPELLSILRNSSAPEVLRDYAVQHVGQWVTPRGAELGYPHEQNPELVKETAEALASLIRDPSISHRSIPGTSLLVLVDMQAGGIATELIEPSIESLNPWFSAVLSGQITTGPLTLISAINAIAMLRLEEHRPSIRALAVSPESIDPSLRLNTIAALGLIGDASDLETLASIADSDSRFHHAALAAQRNLTDRLQ